MKLKLAAEDFAKCYGVLILDDDFMVEIDHSIIPQRLMQKLKLWYSNYYRYTGMSISELNKFHSEIDTLDREGLEILQDIYKANIFEGINEYLYYSRGKDKLLHSINGSNR